MTSLLASRQKAALTSRDRTKALPADTLRTDFCNDHPRRSGDPREDISKHEWNFRRDEATLEGRFARSAEVVASKTAD